MKDYVPIEDGKDTIADGRSYYLDVWIGQVLQDQLQQSIGVHLLKVELGDERNLEGKSRNLQFLSLLFL